MNWLENVYAYCERGHDPSLAAEPLNAVSNIAFLLVAALVLRQARQLGTAGMLSPKGFRTLTGMATLVALVGIGSFIFHTVATRWARLADVLPIAIFMAVYLAYALTAFLGVAHQWLAPIVITFLAAGALAGMIPCDGLLAQASIQPQGMAPGSENCLNGSLGYGPALIVLLLVGTMAYANGRDPGYLIAAAVTFFVSLVMRTIDISACHALVLSSTPRGTHSLWHVLNALTLYLLLRAARQRELRVNREAAAPEP
ncbi:MAG: ceramidase domain-containing protein [Hyphomicrobiaceae bacterium]